MHPCGKISSLESGILKRWCWDSSLIEHDIYGVVSLVKMGEGKKGKTTSITKEREQSISITPRRKIGTTQSEFHLRSGEPQPPQVTDDEEEKEEKKVKKDKKDKKEKGKDRQKDRDREREKEREAGQKRWSAEVDVGASNSPSSSSQGTPSHSSSSSPTSNYSLSPRVIMKSKAPDEADGLMSADRVQLSLDSTYGGMKPSSDAAGVTSGAVQTVIAAGKKTPRSNKVAKIGDFSGLSSSRENKDKKKRRRPSVPSMENFRHRCGSIIPSSARSRIGVFVLHLLT